MNDEMKKPQDIRERTFQYSLRAIKLFQFLHKSREEAAKIIGRQYLRAATSIGANIEESQSGQSKKDFIHKLSIAQKEARESIYWLKLLSAGGFVTKKRVDPLIQETDELIAIITKIIINTKKGLNVK